MTGVTRSTPTSAVPAASATLVTTFSADHSPDAREQAIAWRPRSSVSWTLPGTNTGTRSAASSGSDALGIVEDLHAGSSPHSASTPPRGSVPTMLAWRIASRGAVDAGRLAVPDADDAVEARARQRRARAASPTRRSRRAPR